MINDNLKNESNKSSQNNELKKIIEPRKPKFDRKLDGPQIKKHR